MKIRYWMYFSTFVHMYLYGRLYDWFDFNINHNTIAFSQNRTFAITIICIPYIVSIVYFIVCENLKQDKINKAHNEKNNVLFDVLGYIIKTYNVLCLVYCIIDREFKIIENFLYKISKYVLVDDKIVSFMLLLFGLIAFGLLERYKK